jgi:hypothetical protein
MLDDGFSQQHPLPTYSHTPLHRADDSFNPSLYTWVCCTRPCVPSLNKATSLISALNFSLSNPLTSCGMGDNVNIAVAHHPGNAATTLARAVSDSAPTRRSQPITPAAATREGQGEAVAGAKEDHNTCAAHHHHNQHQQEPGMNDFQVRTICVLVTLTVWG